MKGEKRLREQLRSLGPEAKRRVARVTYSIALDIEAGAQLRAPTGATSLLQSRIRTVQSQDGLSADVGIHSGDEASYGRYVETGTRPGTWRPFGQGSGLRLWALRKLGDEGAAYPVAKKIMLEGTPAQPYLGPAFEEHEKKYVPAIKKELKDLP